MGSGPRHTWHRSPQLPHCPWGRGWAAPAATDPRLRAFFPVDSSQGMLWAQLGQARGTGGHLGHEWPRVDGRPPAAGSV